MIHQAHRQSARPEALEGRAAAWIVVALVAATLVACGGGGGAPTSDVAGRAPWDLPESLVYAVRSEKGEKLGTMELKVEAQGSDVKLTQEFAGTGRNSDVSSVVVGAADLKPRSSTRRIVQPDGKEQAVEVAYTEEGALVRHGDKQSGLSIPEHAYDNDTSLFLWRTLDFPSMLKRPDEEARYVTIITNRRSRQTVSLRVIAKETVRVPAGEFQAWRLEIKASNAQQTAWYADTRTRPLIKYDNDRGLIFELTCCVAP